MKRRSYFPYIAPAFWVEHARQDGEPNERKTKSKERAEERKKRNKKQKKSRRRNRR